MLYNFKKLSNDISFAIELKKDVIINASDNSAYNDLLFGGNVYVNVFVEDGNPKDISWRLVNSSVNSRSDYYKGSLQVENMSVGTYYIEFLHKSMANYITPVIESQYLDEFGAINFDVKFMRAGVGSIYVTLDGSDNRGGVRLYNKSNRQYYPSQFDWNNGDLTHKFENIAFGSYQIMFESVAGYTVPFTMFEYLNSANRSINVNASYVKQELGLYDITISGGHGCGGFRIIDPASLSTIVNFGWSATDDVNEPSAADGNYPQLLKYGYYQLEARIAKGFNADLIYSEISISEEYSVASDTIAYTSLAGFTMKVHVREYSGPGDTGHIVVDHLGNVLDPVEQVQRYTGDGVDDTYIFNEDNVGIVFGEIIGDLSTRYFTYTYNITDTTWDYTIKYKRKGEELIRTTLVPRDNNVGIKDYFCEFDLAPIKVNVHYRLSGEINGVYTTIDALNAFADIIKIRNYGTNEVKQYQINPQYDVKARVSWVPSGDENGRLYTYEGLSLTATPTIFTSNLVFEGFGWGIYNVALNYISEDGSVQYFVESLDTNNTPDVLATFNLASNNGSFVKNLSIHDSNEHVVDFWYDFVGVDFI